MSDLVPPRVRRNNLVTFVLLVLFAIGLCAFVLISMRVHAQRRANNPAATGFIQFGVRRLDAAFSGGDSTPPTLGSLDAIPTRQAAALQNVSAPNLA